MTAAHTSVDVQPRHSVIVPCRNTAAVVGSLLDELREQTAGRAVEVVVVDDASDDDTAEIAYRWATRYPDVAITVARARSRGWPNRSRNVGALLSHGQYLIFVDGDDAIRPQWFASISDALDQASPRTMVTGLADFLDGRPPIVRPDAYGLPAVFGGNFGCDRALFDACGGFDESIRLGGTEDEFALRAQLRHDADVVVCQDAVISYRHTPECATLRWRFVRQVTKARGWAYLYGRCLEMQPPSLPRAFLARSAAHAVRSLFRVVTGQGGLPRSEHLIRSIGSLAQVMWLLRFRMVPSAPVYASRESLERYDVLIQRLSPGE